MNPQPNPQAAVPLLRFPKGVYGDPTTHRAQLNKPKVARLTLATLNAWRDHYGVPVGRSIDAMVEFCLYHPGFRLPIGQERHRDDDSAGLPV